MAQISGYVGRFAPSPTGPLHLGSLTAALASWADARAQGGKWLLRIEDIDPEREQAGASDQIVNSLKAHGMRWDEPITYQSQRSSGYDKALAELRQKRQLYACTCTRKHLRALASSEDHSAYPGFCREKHLPENDNALRFAVPAHQSTCFQDANYGNVSETVADTIGDFIVRRRGPYYAYQLAVVVDDAAQGVTNVVRGSDLLDNTARQIVLQQALGYSQPAYLHVPVLTTGVKKLSKQSGATALDNTKPLANLVKAWIYLGQEPAKTADFLSVDSFLSFAVSKWKRCCIGNVPINILNDKLVNTNG